MTVQPTTHETKPLIGKTEELSDHVSINVQPTYPLHMRRAMPGINCKITKCEILLLCLFISIIPAYFLYKHFKDR